MFDHYLIKKTYKIIIDIVMICFINKETLIITYNFTYLNKINSQI
jgi:hypothetical protein